MHRISRVLEFDAGHRVLNHEGKCAHLHGHRYKAVITVTAANLDSLGRVVDFSVIKEKIGGWIDRNWDHNMILHPQDPLIKEADVQNIESRNHYFKRMVGRDPYIMGMVPYENPTAENMAAHLFFISCHLMSGTGLIVKRVRIYETPNCWADFSNP